MNIESIIKKIKKNNPQADSNRIRAAYNFAKVKHQGQKRKSGEKYIVHPLFVTDFLSQFNFNTETYIAALLHDTVEDTDADLEVIKNKFGEEVAFLVSGVTKLKRLKGKLVTRESLQNYSMENLRKMFLAMAEDIRVVLIKLSDRLHNIKTLEAKETQDRKRIAQETIEIYAPLANRLGMGEIKGQLEDYSFPHLYPEEYKNIKRLYAKEINIRKSYINKAKRQIRKLMNEHGIEVLDIHGRAKHLYSLYKKLQRYDNNIKNIYDLFAIRVIVKNVSDCYEVLGLIHQNWKPLIGRIKDYISLPKTNGYQSLHTTVLTSDGEILEIQIRTPKMHEEAEYGIAAHWQYEESGKSKDNAKAANEKLLWISQLINWQKEMSSSDTGEKFLESLKIDVFKDRIFSFTPKGKIIDLPDGATPIDFAYNIHSDIGNHCRQVKVNDKIVPLDYKLVNGDRVKIITDNKITPSRDWLDFVKTNNARNQIKAFYKKLDRSYNIELGRKILNSKLQEYENKNIEKIPKSKINKLLQKFGLAKLDDLLVQIALGEIRSRQVMREIFQEKDIIRPYAKKIFSLFGNNKEDLIATIEGQSGFLTNIAKCCNPSKNDKIKAYITRSKGASIHRADCKELTKNKDGRVVNASWQSGHIGIVMIKIDTLNRVGMLRDLTEAISKNDINIKDVRSSDSIKKDLVNIQFSIEIKNLDQLFNLLNEIRKIDGVINIKRKTIMPLSF